MRKFNRISALCLLVFIFTDAIIPQSNSLSTQNVIIFNIDGIRYDEGFGTGNTFLHFIYDSLKPKGTAYTDFYNTGVTVTNAAHSTIVTGVRQTLPNNHDFQTLIRPYEPTIAEYIRKYKSLPKNQVFFISGKNEIWEHPVSLYPGFGESYEPTIFLTNENDTTTYSDADRIIDLNHPKLCYILFAQVDAAGHTGDSSKYLGAIRQVDSLIYKLYKKITTDSVYQGNTTIIITTDHGRHDEQHGGWRNHGDHCRGCRHLIFLAIGPDIKVNAEISVRRDQTDIAPTIGHLLGFPVPLAEGKVLTEMFKTESRQNTKQENLNSSYGSDTVKNLSGSAGPSRNGISRSPSISQKGTFFHVVYSDNLSGDYCTYYLRSGNSGADWTLPYTLFAGENSAEIEPVVSVISDNIILASITGYKYLQYDSTYIWTLKGRISTDNGENWNPEFYIDTLYTISRKHSASMSGTNISMLSQKFSNVRCYLSRDSCSTFRITEGNSQLYTDFFSGTLIDTVTYAVWQTIKQYTSPYWNIYYRKIPSTMQPFQLTYNNTHSYSYLPKISSSENTLHLVYQTLSNVYCGTNNNWELIYRRNNLVYNQWGSSCEPAPYRTVYYPNIKTSEQGKIYIIWSDYYENSWSIYGTRSTDNGQTWFPPEKLSPDYAFILNPDFTVSNDTVSLCYQGYSNGKWDVFFTRRLMGNVTLKQNEQVLPEAFYLKQNYPNPFNNSTLIEYLLPQKVYVKIRVYDILGKEIQTLVNEVQEKGLYNIRYNSRELPSGIYFCKIEAGNFTETKKMFLVK